MAEIGQHGGKPMPLCHVGGKKALRAHREVSAQLCTSPLVNISSVKPPVSSALSLSTLPCEAVLVPGP